MTEKDSDTSRVLAIEEENRRLKRAVEELTILNELALRIGASLNSEEIVSTIIRRSLRALDAEQGVITLVDEEAKQPMKTLVRTMISSSEYQPLHLNQSLLGWMHLNKKPLLMNDPQNDDRFRGVRWDETIHSLICVPLLVKSELKGVLTVYNKRKQNQFTEEDQRLLAIIAGQSAQVIENARLYEREQALFRMQEEVRLAFQIQLGLLPKTSPKISGYDIAGVSIPAQVVGGDYFDFITMDENRLAFCLGDISGKGLAAALLMANLQAMIRGQTLLKPSPSECLRRSNTLLFRSTEPDRFATLFYGVLDTQTHEVRYCNAGHDRPYLFSQAEDPVRLEAGGIILSCLEEFPYEDAVVSLSPGDVLVVFSDGITEAMSEESEQYGEERLLDLLKLNLEESASRLIEKMIASVREFAGKREQTDDMTVVIVKREQS